MRQQHRPKLGSMKLPFHPGLITQSLGRNDPRRRTPEARAAVDEEVKALREEKTLNEDDVYELSKARELFPDGHFSRIFAVVGIKNYEFDESEWI